MFQSESAKVVALSKRLSSYYSNLVRECELYRRVVPGYKEESYNSLHWSGYLGGCQKALNEFEATFPEIVEVVNQNKP